MRLPAWLSRPGAAFVAVILAVATLVAIVASSGSYQHQYELDIKYGQAHWVAGMQPLSVEGLVAAATLAIWYAASMLKLRAWQVWGAYLMLAAGIAQTALMNLAADHHYAWPWLGPEISVWPAVAFVASYEMAVWIVRKRQDAQGPEVPAQSALPVPHDNLDAAIHAMIVTHLAGNGHSARGLAARFELPPKLAGKVRQAVLAEANGHAPDHDQETGTTEGNQP